MAVWTEEETERLMGMVAEGKNTLAIARALRMSWRRVQGKINAMRPNREHTPPRGRSYNLRTNGEQRWERKCLCCQRPFVASSPYLRLCDQHRRGD